MKKLIALFLVLSIIAIPAFATVTPTVKGMTQTTRGVMIWGTFTGLTSGTAQTITIPRINYVTSLSTWAASVVSTSGAVSIKAVAKGVITISQESTSAANPSSGYFWVIGK